MIRSSGVSNKSSIFEARASCRFGVSSGKAAGSSVRMIWPWVSLL